MRISDWSSDVCSSDLHPVEAGVLGDAVGGLQLMLEQRQCLVETVLRDQQPPARALQLPAPDRIVRRLDRVEHRACARQVLRQDQRIGQRGRSEEHTSELQSLMRSSYAVFCLKKK